ncbi:MAG: hypothetical protein WC152_02540 [Candidatus Izemoplasmatales bacterium]|nr:hypothetical protein [Candidatus Izemoplasmatales bacterium]
MEIILKQIKSNFVDFVKEKKIKTKYSNSHNMQILSLIPIIKDRKKTIIIDFIYLVNEEGLDVRINYIEKNETKQQTSTTYSFSQTTKNIEIPFFDSETTKHISDSFKYEIVNDSIKSIIPVSEQAEIFVKIVKDNYNNIITHLIKF